MPERTLFVPLAPSLARKLPAVNLESFVRRTPQGAPSTQFAETIVVLPQPHDAPPASARACAPDGLATDEPGSAAMPDVVTDVRNLPEAATDAEQTPTLSNIGRYALKRRLGAGGLGTVFEAWDPLLSRTVAIKTLHHLSSEPEGAQGHPLDGLLLNEARAAAGLSHRYIVTVHDAGLSPHGVYIAMERLHGRDLQRALADGWRPTVEQSLLLVRRVADALAYAHARGVVHCDIKPANIFLQRKDRPKVLDFGIARLMHGAGVPLPEGTVAGSPRYRAPEQLVDAPIDARTDLFSLGVVMYELLTGTRAFGGSSLGEIDRAVLQHTPTPVHELCPEVPLEVSAIVARLMERDPARRHSSATELSAELRRWLAANSAQGEPGVTGVTGVMAALPPQPAPVAAPSRRAGAARGLLAAAVLAGVAALALGLLQPWAQAPTGPAAAAPQDTSPRAPAGLDAAATATAANAGAVTATDVGAGSAPGAEDTGPAGPAGNAAAGADAATAKAGATAPGRTATSAPATLAAAPTGATRRSSSARTRTNGAEDSAHESRRADATAAAAAPTTGALLLAVSPWGEVEVDGRPSGTTPPLTRLTLPAGTHSVTLRNADFPPYTVQIQISADKAVTLRHRFGS